MSGKALQPERLEQSHAVHPNLFVALHIQRFLDFIRNDKRPVRRELPFATHFALIIKRHDAEHGKILGQPLSGLQSVAKHYNFVIFLLPSLRRPVSCRGQFADNHCAEGTVWLSSMRYVINLSEASDHLLRQLCDSGKISPTDGISPVEFLSAFVEDQLDELFARRERRKSGRNKRAQSVVQSAKDHAKVWSEAAVATHTAVKALEKLVTETMVNSKTARPPKSSKSFRYVSPGKRV